MEKKLIKKKDVSPDTTARTTFRPSALASITPNKSVCLTGRASLESLGFKEK